MHARLWTALVLLAGVFALHGVQCAGAATTAHAGVASMTAAAAAASGGAAPWAATAADGDGLHAGDHPATLVSAAGAADPNHGSAPHDAGGHLWTICLAVLATGLAVLLVLAGHRPVRRGPAALPRSLARVIGALVPPHPPDLHVLCVLRT
ncbi:hypothetical protein [Modestobacter altitudinis]|uniref:hypothetical protein n=1 Tax=Modestobacter altitudinis TaxID=2213158 RepID=UPI00110CF3C9|nr:hypothetical protein [Modestobacter altitudinis]